MKARTKDWIHTFGVLVHSKQSCGTLDQESPPCQLDCQGQRVIYVFVEIELRT